MQETNAVFLVLVNAHAWNMQLESGPLNSHVVAPQALLLPLLEHELEKERNCEYCLSQHATLTFKCTMGLNALITAFLISRAIAKKIALVSFCRFVPIAECILRLK